MLIQILNICWEVYRFCKVGLRYEYGALTGILFHIGYNMVS
jgi:hypothetical protein